MRAPARYPAYEPWDETPTQTADVPTVYPVDDHVTEGLLGPDGNPYTEGTRRKHPIGFTKDDQA